MLTKNAVGNLINRYRSVLANCRLLNAFGTLALATALSMGLLTATDAKAADKTTQQDVDATATTWESEGNITIENASSAFTSGVKAVGTGSVTIALTTDHSITVSCPNDDVTLYGIYAERDTNSLNNNGGITVTATAANDHANTYGMLAKGDVTNTLTNGADGSIKVTATGTADDTGEHAEAYGMLAEGDVTNTLTNSGEITVTATNDSDYAVAYGMWADENFYGTDLTNTFINSGDIKVTAKSESRYAEAYGMQARETTNTLTNSGSITVEATAAANYAYAVGMRIDGGNSTLNNTGKINVTTTGGSAKAYQAYVTDSTANVGTWNMKLGETYGTGGTGYYVFGVGNEATLHFGPDASTDGATFTFYGKDDAYEDGKCYPVEAMVNIEESQYGASVGTVTGYIAEVKSTYEFLEVELVNADGTPYDFTSPSWDEQYIKGSLAVTEDNSPIQLATEQHIGSMSANLNQLRNIVANQTRTVGEGLDFGKVEVASKNTSPTSSFYANADTTFSDASYVAPDAPLWKVFAMPYYSQSGANNNAYDTNMYGIAMGVTRSVTDDLSLGVHAGFSKGSGDSDLTDSDSTAYTVGMHAAYNMGKSLFFRGQLSGFIGESELDMIGSAGGITRANADMDTNGLYAMLAAGYDIPLAAQHIITPELAVSYFYAHMDGFDTHFYNAGVKDAAFGMESESYDAWYADATVRWTGAFGVGEGMLKPTAKVGVRQALSDPEIASTMKFGSTATTTYSDANETAFICEAGLAWEVDDLTLSATYTGEFGDEEYSHMGMFKVDWEF